MSPSRVAGEKKTSIEEFESIYKTYLPMVSKAVASFKITGGAADDVIQDTFIQAWKSLDSLKDNSSLKGWILTIARNNCLKAYNSNKRHISIQANDPLDTEENEIILVAADDYASFHFEKSAALLQSLIEDYTEEPRGSIARLFYLQKKSVKDIVAMLGLGQNTVLSHLRRFRIGVASSMAQLMDEYDVEIHPLP